MINRRNFLGLGVGAGAAAALAACGSSGPSGSGSSGGSSGGGAATYWSLSGPPGEPYRQAAIDRFNKANPDTRLTATFYQNDAYKQKIKTSIGAGQGPTMIWGWG
ncbi:extracellular solute-binding protein, partial [Actinoplanes sp. TRM 88003]